MGEVELGFVGLHSLHFALYCVAHLVRNYAGSATLNLEPGLWNCNLSFHVVQLVSLSVDFFHYYSSPEVCYFTFLRSEEPALSGAFNL